MDIDWRHVTDFDQVASAFQTFLEAQAEFSGCSSITVVANIPSQVQVLITPPTGAVVAGLLLYEHTDDGTTTIV